MRRFTPISLLGLLSFAGPAPAQDAKAPDLPAAAVAGADGARIWNVYSENGRVLRTLAPGEPCIVRERVAGAPGGTPGAWVKVEIPGGIPCFVHEELLAETGDAGIVEVKGNRVNLRPLPSSGIEAFPFGQVARGIRLRLLEKLDGGWMRVLSPEGITAWADESDLSGFGSIDAARPRLEEAAARVEKEWRDSIAGMSKPSEIPSAPPAAPAVPAPQQPDAPEEPGAALARAEAGLRSLERRWDEEKAKATRADFETALRGATEEDARKSIRARLDRLDLLEAIERERVAAEDLLARQREMRKQAVDSVLQRAEEIARANEAVVGGRDIRRQFDAYGWIIRSNVPPGRPVYRLDRGGIFLFELLNPDGRYDLDAYVGREVGVRGRALAEEKTLPVRFEVTRIEIISNTPVPRPR